VLQIWHVSLCITLTHRSLPTDSLLGPTEELLCSSFGIQNGGSGFVFEETYSSDVGLEMLYRKIIQESCNILLTMPPEILYSLNENKIRNTERQRRFRFGVCLMFTVLDIKRDDSATYPAQLILIYLLLNNEYTQHESSHCVIFSGFLKKTDKLSVCSSPN